MGNFNNWREWVCLQYIGMSNSIHSESQSSRRNAFWSFLVWLFPDDAGSNNMSDTPRPPAACIRNANSVILFAVSPPSHHACRRCVRNFIAASSAPKAATAGTPPEAALDEATEPPPEATLGEAQAPSARREGVEWASRLRREARMPTNLEACAKTKAKLSVMSYIAIMPDPAQIMLEDM